MRLSGRKSFVCAPPKCELFVVYAAGERGWERAVDAQIRIVTAIRDIVGEHRGGDLAIATHGAVGTLLWCAFARTPIDRCHDQPGQGHYWIADLSTLEPRHGWRSLD